MPVTCWYYNVSQLSDPVLFEQGMRMLPWDERREKTNKLRFDKDKRLSLGAGLLAADTLRRAGIKDLTLNYSDKGRPSPANPVPGILADFNLSHSGCLAVCAGAVCPVGVDVETVRHAEEKLINRAFTQDDAACILGSADPDYLFTKLWTRKESLLKMSGEGLGGMGKDIRVFLPPDGINFYETVWDGHLICVCLPVKEEVLFREWVFTGGNIVSG